MSIRTGQLEVRDGAGGVLGPATVLIAPGASVVNGVLSIPGVSSGAFDALSYKGASAPSATEFDYLAGVTSSIQGQFDALGTASTHDVGTASGDIPVLGAGGKLASSVLPAVAITDTFVVASQAAMLALTAETGDVAVRTDLNKSFILAGANPATLAHWQELLTPTDAVLSVNGQTGVVVLTTQHITEHASNLYHTPARVNTLIAAQVGVTVQGYDAGLAALAAFNTNGLLVQTADNTFAGRTLAAPAAGLTITNPAGTAGNPTFALANDLAAVESLAGSGLAVRTGTDTWTLRQIVAPAAGLTIADPSGTAGNPTISLANDLAALEGLSSTGIAVRTGSDAWLQRSVAAGTGISVTNGDGVSGNPTVANTGVLSITGTANQVNASASTGAVTLSLPQSIHTGASPTFVGLTLTGNLSAVGVSSSLIPSVTDTYDLGSSTKLWRKGWLSELDAVLFAKNTVTLIGGWLLVTKNEGAIPVGQDVGTGDTTIDFGQAMTPNDFVLFRAAGSVEYVQVGTLSSGTRYNVTRNLDGTGANAWPAGSVYAVLGNTTNGRIELNANDTPRISLIKQGATYNAQTELLRVGDLNGGWLGYSSETYGFAVGEYAAGKAWLSVDPTNGIRVGLHSVINGQWDTSGNLALGQVATDSGNAFWNNSNKRFEFRGGAGGTVVQTYIDTDGSLRAASGGVVLDNFGLTLSAASGSAKEVRWFNGATQAGTIFMSNSSGVSTGSVLVYGTVSGQVVLDAQATSGTPNAAQINVVALDTGHNFARIGAQSGTFDGLGVGSAASTPTATLDVAGDGKFSGPVNTATGFRVSGAATSGNVLRGNGTNFISAQLAFTDLSVTTTGSGSVVLATSPTLSALTVTGALVVDTTTLVVDAPNNRVGIGTASPSHLLTINSAATPTGSQTVWRANNAGGFSVLAYSADNIQQGYDADWVGSVWTARHTSAARISKISGKLVFSGDAGLTSGSGFTPTDRLTLELSTGNFGVGTSDQFGSGSGVVGVKNAAANPSSNPTGGGVLYADGGAGKWRGSSGTTTTFGPAEPHCPDCGRDFVLEWQNEKTGHLQVCMWCFTEGLTVMKRAPAKEQKPKK